ncbi:hypothetical protein CR983_00585 [Candidatus Saccharibacteria bacterium]|nr:MAG: hypothetical protein CR983_00585 [Candidatus Saccharibacteria bacterium]
MVPALLSYGMLMMMVILSFVSPLAAAIYLLALIITMIFKAIGLAFHSIVGHRRMMRAQAIDWNERLKQLEHPKKSYERIYDSRSEGFEYAIHRDNVRLIAANPSAYPRPSEVYNVVIIAAYNEPYAVIDPTLQSLIDSTYDRSQMIVVFAYEERGGKGIRQTAQKLAKKYADQFCGFYTVMHPDNLPNELVGKGSNITYAGEWIERQLDKQKIAKENVIITTLDCDNKPHRSYFDYVTYEFIVHQDRARVSFQPIALYFGNIWDTPAPMRVIATGNSFWTIVSSMRPHLLRNFAAHSQPMSALSEMGYWSKRSIVEDGHQYWRSYFYFSGHYEVVPIHLPVYQDAVMADTFKATLVAQFKQLRRWGYGASDVPYVAVRLFSRKRTIPFGALLARFIRLIDSHVSLATIAILVAIGGWVPLLVNPDASQQIAAHNLPEVVSYLQRGAMIGLFITILLSLKMLPPRPARYKKRRTFAMVAQWLLMPITAIAYNSAASLTAQTHLLLGKYLDKFDVTDKSTKET